MRSSRKKLLVGATAAVGVLGIGVAAFAFWTTGGSGDGTASTGTTVSVTVNQTTSTISLYPGGETTLSGNFDNTNSGPVQITSVTASIPNFSFVGTGPNPCTQADFSLTQTTATTGVPGEIPVGTGVGAWGGIKLKMNDLGTNQDSCKSLTNIPIHYVAA